MLKNCAKDAPPFCDHRKTPPPLFVITVLQSVNFCDHTLYNSKRSFWDIQRTPPPTNKPKTNHQPFYSGLKQSIK